MTAGSMSLSAAIRHGDEQVDSGAGVDCVAELLAEITRSAIAAFAIVVRTIPTALHWVNS